LSYFAALSFIGVECVGYGGSGPGLFLVWSWPGEIDESHKNLKVSGCVAETLIRELEIQSRSSDRFTVTFEVCKGYLVLMSSEFRG
jgi:hypothetical protein